ncbi:DUF3973 domain-containing protein [Paenibacillus gyeongsangnamensis]|uniref:DUF3973 domain-containing protein n=1 Tax=Paenibacillus gyeongsangnamensis TaxID=3388067 RepID=UPI0039081794
MYYCIQCQTLHPENYSIKEKIFVSGYRYEKDTLYNVGLCEVHKCNGQAKEKKAVSA